VYATVVHDVGLHHTVAVGFHYLCQSPTKKVIAHMTKVQRLVGIWAGVLYHHQG
jgi:hypothetical protein